MSKNWNITLKNIFILAVLSISFRVNAQQPVNPDALAQPITQAMQVQVLELLTMDCGMNEGLNKFTTALEKLPADVSPIFIKVLNEGAPEEILDSARRKAEENYKVRQAWLKSNAAELFDKQTVARLSKVSLNDYIANSMRRLNIRYEENAILGLKQIGKSNAIDVIQNAVKQQPELSILGEKAIQSINKREYIKIDR